jgi:hypothetical protein
MEGGSSDSGSESFLVHSSGSGISAHRSACAPNRLPLGATREQTLHAVLHPASALFNRSHSEAKENNEELMQSSVNCGAILMLHVFIDTETRSAIGSFMFPSP